MIEFVMKRLGVDGRNLLILLILAAIPRFFLLGTIPAGINFDEIDYLINAKTVYVAGTDISGQWNPLTLTPIPDEDPKGELIAVLLAPFYGPFPFSLFLAKLPFTLAGISSVLLLYIISKKLFNRGVALFTGIVAAFNPLMIFSSRIGYDGPFTAVFLLSALAIMLYARGWWLLLSLPFLFLSFFGYVGMKLVLIPFTLITAYYCWRVVHEKKDTRKFVIIVLFVLILLGSYVWRLPMFAASGRSASLLSPFHPLIVDKVNEMRRLSLLVPEFFSHLLVNKYTVFLRMAADRMLRAFSMPLLFTAGDDYHFFFVWNHGIFYLFDLVFLATGFYLLVKKYRKVALLFLLLMPFFILPSILGDIALSYVFRSYLLYIWLVMVVGLGMYFVFAYFKNNRYVMYGLILIYIVQFSYFSFEFYIRNPVYHQDQSQFSYRVFSRLLKEESNVGRRVVVLAADKRQVFQQYLLYGGVYDRLNDDEVRASLARKFREDELEWENVLVTTDCSKGLVDEDSTLVLREDIACDELRETLTRDYTAVARISDSGHEFRIYGATTCFAYELPTYVRSVSLSDLSVEKLSSEQFCTTFITQYVAPDVEEVSSNFDNYSSSD